MAYEGTATGAPEKSAQSPRRSTRVALAAGVVARRSGKVTYSVTVQDASCHGCRIQFVERPRLGERTWIKFEGLEALEALVCWVDGFVAGVQFEKAIHPAVFDTLVARLRP